MITLHFVVSNYSDDFIELSLCSENKVLTSQQVNKYAWNKNESNVQDYWRFKLISEIRKDIECWKPKYELPKDIYMRLGTSGSTIQTEKMLLNLSVRQVAHNIL